MGGFKLSCQSTQKSVPALSSDQLNTDWQTVRGGMAGNADARATRNVDKPGEGRVRPGAGFLAVDSLGIGVWDWPWKGRGGGRENDVVICEENRE